MTAAERLVILQQYSAGHRGTRETIELRGMEDHADLLIALAQTDLTLAKPPDTPELAAHRERARAILIPRLPKLD